MRAQIQKGAEVPLTFGTAQIGHKDCNIYASTLSIDGNLYDMLESREFIELAFSEVEKLNWDRNNLTKTFMNFFKSLFEKQKLAGMAVKSYGPKFWSMRADLIEAKGKINRLTILMHNFMDASQFDGCRIHEWSFMVMTQNRPISMCMHNAKRDEFILQPILPATGEKRWSPLTGPFETPQLEKAAAGLGN